METCGSFTYLSFHGSCFLDWIQEAQMRKPIAKEADYSGILFNWL